MSSLQQSIAEANRLRGRSNQKKRAEYFGKKHDWELMVDMLCDRGGELLADLGENRDPSESVKALRSVIMIALKQRGRR